jgi:hypothetical protein
LPNGRKPILGDDGDNAESGIGGAISPDAIWVAVFSDIPAACKVCLA